MSSNPNDRDFDPDDRRKHLDYVQAVIARLAQSSAIAKGWSLTIAGAAFGFSTLNQKWYLSLLGLAVIGSFSVLDMHYLYEERLFRGLYRGVCAGTVPSFSMDKDAFRDQASKHGTYMSWSVLGFYSPLAVAGVIVVGIALLIGGPQPPSRPHHDCLSHATPSAPTHPCR